MALQFHRLVVKNVTRETPDCVSVSFEVPEGLKKEFEYKAGQNLTLRTWIDGREELRRSYSLCSSPLDNEWKVAIKKVQGGRFSTFANEQLRPMSVLEVMPPTGKFTVEPDPAGKKRYVAFAAGSGITPVISIIKTILRAEPGSSFTLVYGNRNRSSIIFREELEALKNKYMTRFRIVHLLSREVTDAAINHGRIDAEKCEALFTRYIEIDADQFFLCGPEGMIFCVRDYLKSRGVDEKKIHFELFTSPGQKLSIHRAPVIEEKHVPKSRIVIIRDGRQFEFDLAYDSEPILDAAIQNGIDLPYSCKGGVCSTCSAKLTEGEVKMDVCYALEPEDVAKGYILTCQSHPKTERVVVNFDNV
ncbi:MAG TPA: 1,2-phenylacetyl-CoA epoxidase subunit PaaE [Chitinophagaceae bacterium]